MSLNIDNTEDKKINLNSEDTPGVESVININYNDNDLIGVDLLANTSKKIEDVTDNVSNNGYSSGGEESNKSNKEDFNFFSNAEPSEEKNIKVDIKEIHTSPPVQDVPDPKMDNKVYGNEFKSIHTMSPNEIKNEKIDMLYKFRKLEGQCIQTTMN